MSAVQRTGVIVNPRSGSGQTDRKWPAIERLLVERLGPVEVRRTERPGDGTALARALLEAGFDRIVAAGGDGTISEAANGFLERDEPVRPGAVLGILPLGTGGDFNRTLGIPKDLRRAVEVLATGRALRIDVGKAAYRDPQGSARTRYFVNLASFGMGGDVAARASNFLNPLGGTVSFLYASAVALFRYQGKRVRLRLDGSPEARSVTIHNVAVGNGRFHGGGMQACPTALLHDGVLEVTVIEYMRVWEAIRDFPVLYSDDVYRHPKVQHLRARRLTADSDDTVLIEIDGEPLGKLPLDVEVLPQRLNVLVAPDSPLLGAQ